MQDVMLDLETWGTGAGCVIRSIGAVQFDPRTPRLGEELYFNITEEDQITAGAYKDADTVKWWASQGDSAKAVLEDNQQPFKLVAESFHAFFKKHKIQRVWAQGSNFDPVLWEASCALFGMKSPWRFYNTRDTRTAYAMAGFNTKTMERKGIYHYALDDCKHQIRCLYKSYMMVDGVTSR